jgi:hypothetical protein
MMSLFNLQINFDPYICIYIRKNQRQRKKTKSRVHTENTHIQLNSPFAANKFH